MGKYVCILAKSFKTQTVYRTSVVMNIAENLLLFFIQISIWFALLGTEANQGVRFSDMVIYLILNTAILTVTRADVASLIEESIADGSVVLHMLRPVSYKFFILAAVLGQNCFQFLTGALPVSLLGIFLIRKHFEFLLPVHLFFFLISMTIGMLLMFELTYVAGLLAFWIQRCWYISWYLDAGLTFFGGTMVPLWFYPKALGTISRFLPFRYITFEAVNIFLHKSSVSDALLSVLIGGGWLILLTILDRFVWRFAVKKMTVNGG